MFRIRTAQKSILIVLLTLGLIFCIAPAAFAEGSLAAEYSVEPTELIGPGEVSITLKLTNQNDAYIDSIRLDAGTGRIFSFGDIDAWDSKSFKLNNVEINEYQIGTDIPLLFTYNENGVPMEAYYSMNIARKTAKPDINATRTAEPSSGAAGDEIVFTYILKNTGDVDLENVTIIDPVSDKSIVEGLFLPVGEKETIEYRLILEKAISSAPSITAESGGGNINMSLDPLEISINEPFLDVIVTISQASESGTPAQIKVNNTGNIEITALTLSDNEGAVIADGFALSPGKSKSFSYTIPKSGISREFTVFARGKATAAGTDAVSLDVEFSSVSESIAPIITKEDVKLAVNVTASSEKLETPGEVEVSIELDNQSTLSLQNVVISEKTAGAIMRLNTLEKGVTTQKVPLIVNVTTPMHIIVTAQDTAGSEYTFEAEPLTIEVLDAKSDEKDADEENKPAARFSPLIITIVVIVGLLIIAVIALLVVMAKERRQKSDEENSDEVSRILGGRDRLANNSEVDSIIERARANTGSFYDVHSDGDTRKTASAKRSFTEQNAPSDDFRAAPKRMPQEHTEHQPQPQARIKPVLHNDHVRQQPMPSESQRQQPSSPPKSVDELFDDEFLK